MNKFFLMSQTEVKVWSSQYEASATHDIPSMRKVLDWLPRHCPVNDKAQAIVHGDFR